MRGRPRAKPRTPAAGTAAKLAKSAKAHDVALAGLVALSNPASAVVAVEAALLVVSDPEGLDYARQWLAEQ